jgi:hypothetical protein
MRKSSRRIFRFSFSVLFGIRRNARVLFSLSKREKKYHACGWPEDDDIR